MKKLFTLLLFIGCYQASIAQFNAGVGISVITGNEDAFGLQGRMMYGFNEDFVAGFAYNYYFEEDIANIMDFDIQYRLINTNGGFVLNPMAGIRLTTEPEVSTSLHVGVFSVFPINDFNIYLEPKFVISENDAFVVSAGFRF